MLMKNKCRRCNKGKYCRNQVKLIPVTEQETESGETGDEYWTAILIHTVICVGLGIAIGLLLRRFGLC